MNLFRGLIVLIFSVLIIGCASNGNSLCPAYDSKLISTNLKKIDTSKSTERYIFKPDSEISGIKAVNLSGYHLSVSLVNKGFYEEYSIPLVDEIRQENYEGHPSRVMLGTFMTGGIIWLDPKAPNLAFGCTKETLMGSYPDISKQNKTGKSKWSDLKKNHAILVSGFGKNYEFWQEDEDIDLSSAILNSDIDKSTNIEITCLDCELGNQEQSIANDLKKKVLISADFRELKASLVAQYKANKIEQAKRDKEAEVQRGIQEKEDLKLRKESLGVPLEEFKEQCKQIGFKEKSPDFGDCVLQLNNSK
jgi:hypothetical protein